MTNLVPGKDHPAYSHGHCTGYGRSSEYNAWRKANRRCNTETDPKYPLYGGRGIEMCDEWRKSFAAFLAHVGPKPGPEYSLDRIDNDGNYEPGNVRWATRKQQVNNRRVSRHPD